MCMTSTQHTDIEVEQKFFLGSSASDMAALESRLVSLGFQRVNGEVSFMDWYFDTPAPYWTLTRRDNWLRYRELLISQPGLVEGRNADTNAFKKQGSWQLKRGLTQTGQATVYEEYEGTAAIDRSVDMIQNTGDDCDDDERTLSVNIDQELLKDGHAMPQLPIEFKQHALLPFARFETKRSSWSNVDRTSKFNDLTIDIDWTDFGYTVGEVEAIVQSENEIEGARDMIRRLIELIGDTDGKVGGAALGKLETFMISRDEDHYLACVEAGSMKKT